MPDFISWFLGDFISNIIDSLGSISFGDYTLMGVWVACAVLGVLVTMLLRFR